MPPPTVARSLPVELLSPPETVELPPAAVFLYPPLTVLYDPVTLLRLAKYPPPPIVAPCAPLVTQFPLYPPITFGVSVPLGASRQPTTLFARKVKLTLSVVPRKLVLYVVPLFPVRFQYAPVASVNGAHCEPLYCKTCPFVGAAVETPTPRSPITLVELCAPVTSPASEPLKFVAVVAVLALPIKFAWIGPAAKPPPRNRRA